MKRRQLSILSNASIFFALAFGSALLATARSETDDTSAAREIARIDREFSDLSIEKGMPAACLAYFADDGIAFAPKAVNGKKYWGAHKEFPGTLVWEPAFAAVSSAGDLGYTTGPWELKKKNGAGSAGFGNYVTVWRKRGDWKIALDVGIDNSQPNGPPPPLQALPPDAVVAQRSAAEGRRSYRKTEQTFFERAREDIGKAVIDFAAPELRILRDKSFPAVGISAAQVLLGSEHGKVDRKVVGTTLSSSSDLSYTYGNYSEERGNMSSLGIYLMIWRVDLNGDWKLVLDLQKKVPEDKK
jgi:ketosteroid isomerase-like protein